MAKGAVKAIVGIVTVIIGGTVYGVSQKDIIKNFSAETGMSKEEAENYIENIPEDELVSFEELGSGFIDEGQSVLDLASEIDCINFYYEWETDSLACEAGKSQLITFGEAEIALGMAYRVLGSESASTKDISSAIMLIDKMNATYDLKMIFTLMEQSEIEEAIKTNLYNKALLQAILDSE